MRVRQLSESFADDGAPTADQWRRLQSTPTDRPVVLINLFSFRDQADYGDDASGPGGTGQDAFGRYSAVSAPALESVGGRFVHFGHHQTNLVGDDQTWDLVVIGEYPNLDALVALYEDPAYRDAYRHRVAACDRQLVMVSA